MATTKRNNASKKTKTKKASWIRRAVVIVCAIIAGVLVFIAYRVFGPNTSAFADKKYFYIRTGSTYSNVLEGLEEQNIVSSRNSFDFVARRLGYPSRVKAGRYQIKWGMSNFEIVKLLRSGKQAPVQLVITKLRTKDDFVRKISNNLEADSTALRLLLHDQVYLRQFGLDSNTVMCAVVPNTYEYYWNTSAETAFEKLEKEREEFWNAERKAKARNLGLSMNEVTILAAIVEEETNKNDEKPLIASVYLNRYKKGMRLQADPTVKFALQDFGLKRIREGHTQFDSPYNTYRYGGLPPGPICTPSVKTLDAVLNTPETDYIYFCARSDFSGYHAFAATYQEHLENAHKYQAALNKAGY
ncbi:MAG TPA: endolytic transglycosylase MltG [Chitinophaga sp.]|uniref:endolytic transglycosylase MltG n=1 Tax=Chitinophaga sp. TaxID=1869181 RepID=UPI002F93442C